MKPFFKWSGGKRKEVPIVRKFMPKEFDVFYEPFVGGGAIWLDLERDKSVVNDNYSEVMNFYEVLRNDTTKLIDVINSISHSYGQEMAKAEKNKNSKLKKQTTALKKEVEKIGSPYYKDILEACKILQELPVDCFNDETKEAFKLLFEKTNTWEKEYGEKKKSFKALKEKLNEEIYKIADKYYYHYRNNDFATDFENAVKFYILRQLSFSGMLRFGADGRFNIPFGWYKSFKGIEQNADDIKRVLNNTTFMCEDWKKCADKATEKDFVFLDPPFTRTFTQYHVDGEFGKKEHEDLADWFKTTKAQVMIIINKDEFTESLYNDYIICEYDHKYSIQYRDRMTEKDSNAQHFVAINYKLHTA